jgi:membrane protease YdiL (CAAX protease family)
MIVGSLFCWLVYLLGVILYDHQINNWFVYISRSYPVDKTAISASDFRIYFLIYTLVSMSFSPIGEELFYRGMINRCFAGRFGDRQASYIDNAAFAITHLAHFGLIYQMDQWHFHWVPAFIWMALMFFAGHLFTICKQKSGSLLGAILGHATFNLTMIYCIFYQIL